MNVMRCKSCNELVEIPPVEPVKLVVKEPCRCGLTGEARIWRVVIFGIVSIILALTGSCVSSHYFSTKQIEIMKREMEIKEVGHVSPIEKSLGVPYEVVEKKAEKK